MKNNKQNAANRYSYISAVYGMGEKLKKDSTIAAMPKEWADLYKEGYIHIHDLDAYGLTYNCLTLDILKDFPYAEYEGMRADRQIMAVFEYLKKMFVTVGNEQSGGTALANFDIEISTILRNLGVEFNDANKKILEDSIYLFITWCNNMYSRTGQTSYYITLNIGLADTEEARFVAKTLLSEFEKSGEMIFKPNIVFKVKRGINFNEEDVNHSLLTQALSCTAHKMIPTYLLCDSKPNKDVDPYKLAIMGCRTRVVKDRFGEDASIGRGNIANISINLPRLALETISEGASDVMSTFKAKWLHVASIVKDILIDRYEQVCAQSIAEFPINSEHHLWREDFVDDLHDVFRHGTLSIGFIGLSEAMEVLNGERYYLSREGIDSARDFAKYMRSYTDSLCDKYNLNFSLLATSGELISGKFTAIDRQLFTSPIFDKGFYTNSFHVNVDSGIKAYEKIAIEGPFHNICNGGCITYIELKEAPIGNTEGLLEYVEMAVESGVHYLGINFPKDVCKECGCSGVFDECPHCHSTNITRIRRVSGYLEVLDGFTEGKKNEVKTRRNN